MKPNRILVVEDDQDLRESVTLILELEGFEVMQAENGKAALTLLREWTSDELPSCILLDLMMPIMDGREFLNQVILEKNEEFNHIPIIISSARTNPRDDLKSWPYELEILPKPFEIEKLLKLVKAKSSLQQSH